MRNISNLVSILFFVCLLATACMKDPGNYDVKDIDAIHIELPDGTVGNRVSMKKNFGDTIKPLITYGKKDANAIDTSDYEYKWTITVKISYFESDTLQFPTNKPYLIQADFDALQLSGVLACYLSVTQKSTGLSAHKVIVVLYTDAVAEGWVLLYEKNGASKLGVLSYRAGGYDNFPDISDSLGLAPYLTGKPVSIGRAGTDLDNGIYVAISTDNGVLVVNTDGFKPELPLTSSLNRLISPAPGKPVKILEGTPGYCWQDGNLYQFPFYISPGETISSSNLLGYPVNDLNFNATPRALYNVSPSAIIDSNMTQSIVYDESNARFVNPLTTFDKIVHSPFSAIKLLPDFNLNGFKMVYGRSFAYPGFNLMGALMKNNEGAYYLLLFLPNGVLRSATKITDSRLAQAKHFAIDVKSNYLLFDGPHQVLGYDYNTNTTMELMNLGNEEVSVMKFQPICRRSLSYNSNDDRPAIYSDLANKLVLCTYSPTAAVDQAGTFQLMQVRPGGQPLQSTYKVTGMPIIKDVTFNGLIP